MLEVVLEGRRASHGRKDGTREAWYRKGDSPGHPDRDRSPARSTKPRRPRPAETSAPSEACPPDEASPCTRSHTPNARTRKALRDADAGKNLTRYVDEDDLFRKLGIKLGQEE